ncbi:MAG TPA: DUF255 domain-containing protein [Bacteroidales bacterium]|nr:DUF255 domain-containing protein [Bacteroidales bacterium]
MKPFLNLIILSVIFILLSQTAFSQEPKAEIKWYSFDEAMALQEENPKKVFVDVYTDWCGWCKKMDKTTFTEKEIIDALNENFYAVKFDAESTKPVEFQGKVHTNPNPDGRRSTHQLTYAMLGRKVSYPSYAIFSEKNQKMTVVKGYLKKERLLPILDFLGNDHFQNMKWEDYLTKNNISF